MNPYSTAHLWDDETKAAYEAMPKYNGYTLALDYVKPSDVSSMEQAWREWCKATPRHLWPLWLKGWPDRKRLKGLV